MAGSALREAQIAELSPIAENGLRWYTKFSPIGTQWGQSGREEPVNIGIFDWQTWFPRGDANSTFHAFPVPFRSYFPQLIHRLLHNAHSHEL